MPNQMYAFVTTLGGLFLVGLLIGVYIGIQIEHRTMVRFYGLKPSKADDKSPLLAPLGFVDGRIECPRCHRCSTSTPDDLHWECDECGYAWIESEPITVP